MADKDEISIDFSRISNFFKKKKKPGKEEKHEKKEDEISFDLASIKSFFIKNQKLLLILIPLLIAIFAGAFIRMQSMYLHQTDEWAQTTVHSHYKSQIKNQISAQYPNLPDTNRNLLVEEELTKFLEENNKQIEKQTEDLSDNFKQNFRDENSYNYMPDIDPYTYLRQARNYLDHGYVGDELRDGAQWNNHMIAPLGKPVKKDSHSYILAYIYKVFNVFNSKITLMQAACYFPIIFAILSIIPAFFIGRRLGGATGGFFAAMLLAVSTAFVNRTLWGHADTDAYNIFFPLFIIWLFLEAFHQKETKKQALYSGISALFVAGFALTWSGWWYVFDFILGAAGLYLIYLLIKQSREGFNLNKLKKNQKLMNLVLITLVFILVSGVLVSLFTSFSNFYTSPIDPIAFSKLKVAAHETLWPNVYTTVAELNEASFSQVIDSIGGNIFFLISLLGILAMFFIKNEEGKTDTKYFVYGFLFILWYIGIIYASTKGIRFTMMLVPPFAFGFATALSFVYDKATAYFKKSLEIPKPITGILLIVIFLLFFILPPAKASYNVAAKDIPIINDAWYNALNKIRLESEPDAIVNSWWDFGHHFKYYADRAVTFDGASQNSPMAHWIGKTLLTDDEELAVGILRMLDCGSNKAFETLNDYINDTSVSVKMLNEIVLLEKSGAKNYLTNKDLSADESENVLQYTHCNPPENYFITSHDMVGKGGVWAHFGSWDFDKADIWVFTRKMPKEEAVNFITENTDFSEEKAEQLYYEVLAITNEKDANNWIAPWPNYAGTSNCNKADNQTITCANGVEISLDTMEIKLPTQQGVMSPKTFVYKRGADVEEIEYETSFPYSIVYIDSQIAIMDPKLSTSMFTRLFYLDGHGLEHFEKFAEETDITGGKIIVWKVKWE